MSKLWRPTRRRLLLAGGAGLIAAPAIVRAGTLPLLGMGKPAAAAGGTPTTWNPSDKGAGITLSNSNRTATFPSGTLTVRTTASLSGKQYFEMVIGTASGTYNFGLANSTFALTGNLIGSTNAVAFSADGGFVFINFGSAMAFPASGTGDTISWATDATAKLFWLKKNNAGNWNNIGGADPSTGTSGYDFSAVTGPYLIAASMNQFSNDVTLNIASGTWTGTPPSGFANEVT